MCTKGHRESYAQSLTDSLQTTCVGLATCDPVSSRSERADVALDVNWQVGRPRRMPVGKLAHRAADVLFVDREGPNLVFTLAAARPCVLFDGCLTDPQQEEHRPQKRSGSRP